MSVRAKRAAMVKVAFDAAWGLPASQREERIREVCRGNERLVSEVIDLLERSANTEGSAEDQVTTEAMAGPAGAGPYEPPEEVRLIGQRINGFTVQKLLGCGGLSVVFLASQESPKRQVALKVLRRECLGDEPRRRFRFEADVLAQLRHRAIPRIYETGSFRDVDVDRPYHAMELVSGQVPITRHIKTKKITVEDRVRLFGTVCEAIAEVHSRGLVHRDLKPENILVDDEGEVKVIDFGVARQLSPGDACSMTIVGQRIGTPMYMSPEQRQDDPRGIDQRADVFALGCVLYEMISGSLAYRWRAGTTAEEMCRSEPDKGPSELHREAPGADAALSGLVLRACHRDPAERHRSASDLLDAAQAWLARRERRGDARHGLTKWSRVRRRTALTALAILMAGAGFLGATYRQSERLALLATSRSEYETARQEATLESGMVSRFFADSLTLRRAAHPPQPDESAREVLLDELNWMGVNSPLPLRVQASILEALALMHGRHDEHDQAARLLDQSLLALRDAGGLIDPERLFELRFRKATALQRAGRYSEAVQEYDALARTAAEEDDTALAADMYLACAESVQQAGGSSELARGYLEQAQALAESLLEEAPAERDRLLTEIRSQHDRLSAGGEITEAAQVRGLLSE